MRENRVKIILTCLMTIILFLMVRIFIIQVFFSTGYDKAASTQRNKNTLIEFSRGGILDRNGIPFTNRSTKDSMVIIPQRLKGMESEIGAVSSIMGMDYSEFKKRVDLEKLPFVFPVDENQGEQLKAQHVSGVSLVHSLQRYDKNSLAPHILGYLNGVDGNGETGIERFYEKFLHHAGSQSIEVVTDALKNPLQGMNYKIVQNANGSNSFNIKLTLDYHIQQIVEDVLDRNGVKGAVVVEDVNTGDILAMSSKPDFEQNSVDSFLNSPQNELFNKSVASYNVGSIFKIIVAAQALESKFITKDDYFCSGRIRIGNKIFKCTSFSKGGHGEEDFSKAFALSCNPYFIQLGLDLGCEGIFQMAEKFGMGELTGIKEQGIDESEGNLPDIKGYFSDGDIANFSIGQGAVMATPLQVADMLATVANGGIRNKVNLVQGIINEQGRVVQTVRQKVGSRIIRKETAEALKRLMEEVVAVGTGKNAALDAYGGAAGKTGSAETGQSIQGIPVVQAWFAGYFPLLSPKYSVSVFIEDGKLGGEAAAPVFREIAEEIMKKGY